MFNTCIHHFFVENLSSQFSYTKAMLFTYKKKKKRCYLLRTNQKSIVLLDVQSIEDGKHGVRNSYFLS